RAACIIVTDYVSPLQDQSLMYSLVPLLSCRSWRELKSVHTETAKPTILCRDCPLITGSSLKKLMTWICLT
ncbi:hypothetical protein, partial [Bacillus phage SPG24]